MLKPVCLSPTAQVDPSCLALRTERTHRQPWPNSELTWRPTPPADAVAPPAVDAVPIQVSDGALKHLRRLREEKGDAELLLRVGVRSGGCSGLSYAMDFEAPDKVTPDDSGTRSRPPCRHYACAHAPLSERCTAQRRSVYQLRFSAVRVRAGVFVFGRSAFP